MSGLDLHNCVETYLASLSASPTSSPSYSPTSGDEPPTLPPSVEEIYHTASLPNDVTTMVELPSESKNPGEAANDANTGNELQSDFQDLTVVYGKPDLFCFVVLRMIREVNESIIFLHLILIVNDYVELGNFDMSITIYSTPRTNNRRHRILHDDDASFSQEHELAATKYFLQQVYQERFPDLNVNALQLRFTDAGETIFSQGVIRHSSFNGTVGFESTMPSKQDLESTTLDAFVGKTNKATFLKLFHSSFTEDDHTESSNKGRVDVATLYDVSVQKSLDTEDSSTDGVSDVAENASTMEKSHQTVQDSSTGAGNLILTVICVVVVVVILLLGSVYFRGRRAEQQKARSQLAYAKYDDEKGGAVEKFVHDEERRLQYDNTTMVCTSSGNKENDSEEESVQSSLSSNLPDEMQQSGFEQPYPLEISPSYLEEINNQSLREHSDLKLSQDEQDGNASTAWTFSAVGADVENRSEDDASIGYSVGGVSDIIRNMKDFEEMVVSTESPLEVHDEEKGRSNQVDSEDDQLSFLGSVNSTDFSRPQDRKQIDSFIKEILSRDDLD